MGFTVLYEACHRGYKSKVYSVDSVRNRFLVADPYGFFQWVDINLCKLIEIERGD